MTGPLLWCSVCGDFADHVSDYHPCDVCGEFVRYLARWSEVLTDGVVSGHESCVRSAPVVPEST